MKARSVILLLFFSALAWLIPASFSTQADIIQPLPTPTATAQPVESLSFPVYTVDQADLKRELRQFTGCDKHYLDETYYYTDYANASVLLESIEMPLFIPETWDCDDMAWYLKSEMARLYGLNCVGYAEGDHLGFYHAWNVVLTDEGIYTWEAELQEWNNASWYDASLIWF